MKRIGYLAGSRLFDKAVGYFDTATEVIVDHADASPVDLLAADEDNDRLILVQAIPTEASGGDVEFDVGSETTDPDAAFDDLASGNWVIGDRYTGYCVLPAGEKLQCTINDAGTAGKVKFRIIPVIPQVELGQVVLEGDYTTWTIETIYDTGVNYNNGTDAIGILNGGKFFFYDHSANTMHTIDHNGLLLSSITLRHLYWASGGITPWHSVLRKYILDIDNTFSQIIVQSEETELWRRTVATDATALGYTLVGSPITSWPMLTISPDGKWIAVQVQEAVTNNGLILIYKGS